jgi:hypothetical protein
MKRFSISLLAAAITGCINGAPLPPTPASSLAVVPNPDRAAQESQYVVMTQDYLRSQGKDPTQATYKVHFNPRHEDDGESGEPVTTAVVTVDFLNGTVWHVTVNRDGEVTRRATP